MARAPPETQGQSEGTVESLLRRGLRSTGDWLDRFSPIHRPDPAPSAEEAAAYSAYVNELALRFHVRAVVVIAVAVVGWWPLDSLVFTSAETVALFSAMRGWLLAASTISFAVLWLSQRAAWPSGVLQRWPSTVLQKHSGLVTEVALLLSLIAVMGYHISQLPGLSGLQYLHWMPLAVIPFPLEIAPRLLLVGAAYGTMWTAIALGISTDSAALTAPMSFSAGVCFLSVVFGHWLFRLLESSYIHGRRLRALTDELEQRVRSQNRDLAALAQQAMTVRDQERAWLTRELHDALGQELTAVGYVASFALRRAQEAEQKGGQGRQVSAALEQLGHLVERTRHSIRLILHEMRPQILQNLKPEEAFRSLVASVERHSDLTANCDVHGEFPAFDEPTWSALYRVLQEALTNVIRHAEATRVNVQIRRSDSHWEMSVRDDGRGMQQAPDGGDMRLGLVGIRERVAQVGGEVTWDSAPGGVCVSVRLPLCSAPIHALSHAPSSAGESG